ncbi:MAG: hypothetical protein RIQ60_2171 [Pseudomonadota bacterium]|jgi:transposase
MPHRRSRLSDEQTQCLLECFLAGTPARPAAEVAGVNRNTARLCYHHLRLAIARHLGNAAAWPASDVLSAAAVSASQTLGAVRPGRAATHEDALLQPQRVGDLLRVPLAGLIEHLGHVQVVALPGTPTANSAGGLASPDDVSLFTAIAATPANAEEPYGIEHFGSSVTPFDGSLPPAVTVDAPMPRVDAVIAVDEAGPDAEAGLLRLGRLHLVERDEVVANITRHRTLRSFWRRSAAILKRYNGIPRQHMLLYLKECEWRFSDGSHDASLATLLSWYARLH